MFLSWIMLYSFSVFVCLISLTFYKFYLDYMYFLAPDTYTFNLLTRIAGTSITLITFTVPIFWIDMRNIPEYWNRWNIFQVCIFDKFKINSYSNVISGQIRIVYAETSTVEYNQTVVGCDNISNCTYDTKYRNKCNVC